ncbi:ROK family transcriptional regulator [Nonomuraea sp. B1E8]|uniref:ROK family transcriptional regulator n=1 Tax=unclassified Nonomuraea TaxID=2593643 RepID=UPI00325EC432
MRSPTAASRAAATFDVRRHNVAALLRALLKEGPAPRIDLAERLRLSSGATTRITAELTRAGLLEELPALVSGDAGRPRVPLDLASSRFHAVGIHVGLRRTTIGLVDLRGRLVGSSVRVEHDGELDPAVVVTEAADRVAELARETSAKIIGTGFTTVGRVDGASGRIRDQDVLGWTDVDVPALAAGRFPGFLVVESTQRALCKAEMWFGAHRTIQDFVHLFIGNVIGAGIVIGRELHHGQGEGAGQIAHLPLSRPAQMPCDCGRGACLMSVAGDRAVVGRAVREGLLGEGQTIHDLAELARGGDALADYLLRERARAIGEAVVMVMDLLAPDAVIVFGTPLLVPGHIDEIRGEARRWMRREFDAENVITPSALDDNAPVISSATCVLERFYADPFALIG